MLSTICSLAVIVATERMNKTIQGELEYIFNIFQILENRKSHLNGSLSGREQEMLDIGRALRS